MQILVVKSMVRKVKSVMGLLTLSFTLVACASVQHNTLLEGQENQVAGFGQVQLSTSGPNPRSFPAQLRFFDVVNIETQERTRVRIGKAEGAFTMSLNPGHYEIIRIQINEGPFMTESQISHTFQIKPNVLTYLGKWELDVDTPRTQRMVRIKISEDRSSWLAIVETEPRLKTKSVVNFLPEPIAGETRLYAVAPNPKVKYFYRQ